MGSESDSNEQPQRAAFVTSFVLVTPAFRGRGYPPPPGALWRGRYYALAQFHPVTNCWGIKRCKSRQSGKLLKAWANGCIPLEQGRVGWVEKGLQGT